MAQTQDPPCPGAPADTRTAGQLGVRLRRFRVQGFRVHVARVQGLGFRGSGFRVQGLGVWGLGFRV